MCIIVDSNTLAAVLNPTDSEHRQFKPVLDHINSGKSKMIFGGSRFEGEVRKLPKYIKILAEMRKANKIAFASDDKVDALEAKIEKAYTDPLFNDKHIVALAYVANARMVCTKDGVLKDYLHKNGAFYSKHKVKPVVFNERSRSRDMPTGSFRPKCSLC